MTRDNLYALRDNHPEQQGRCKEQKSIVRYIRNCKWRTIGRYRVCRQVGCSRSQPYLDHYLSPPSHFFAFSWYLVSFLVVSSLVVLQFLVAKALAIQSRQNPSRWALLHLGAVDISFRPLIYRTTKSDTPLRLRSMMCI